ncbi:MAG: 6-bladed beta-propeller [Tannerellaceae bacterium]|jgi:hypothetical protein|nr:6-bladed beta-propeller [Tannerellaceae bacterium]
MKAIFLIIIIFFTACNKPGDKFSNLETVFIDLETESITDAADFIEKIEIVPLETIPASLISQFNKAYYCKDLESYIILDNHQIVYLFNKDGKFMSSSERVRGQGPGEYQLIVDVAYNPFSQAIELLDPYGSVYRYDSFFNFMDKLTLKQKNIVFSELIPLNEYKYIFTDAIVPLLHFCDFSNQTIEKTINFETEYIASVSQDTKSYSMIDNNVYYFSPHGINYLLYKIDIYKKSLRPVIHLDFGDRNIDKKMIKSKFGEPRNTEENIKFKKEVNEYLLNSNYPLTMIKLFNDDYIYLRILQDKNWTNLIYNRKTKESFYMVKKSPFRLCYCIDLVDNILLTLLYPYEIDNYIDKKLINKENMEKLESIVTEDNPIIIKYYLK